MSIELSSIGRLRVAQETTFGTQLSGSIGSFKDLRFISADKKLPTEMLRDERTNQRMYTRQLSIIGRRSSELNLKMHLFPSGEILNAAASAPTVPAHAAGFILQTLMGGWVAGQGSAVASGASTTGVTVTTGHGTRFGPGRAVVLPTGAGGALEMREVATVAGDALTWRVPLASVPSVGNAVLNTHTFYLTDDPTKIADAFKGLQFLAESNERDDIWWLLGMMGGFSLELPLNQLPQMTCALKGADWKHDDEVATPLGSGSSLGAATYTDPDPVPFIQSEVIFTDASPAARTRIDISSIQISPNFTYNVIPSPQGINGILRWHIQPGIPTVQFTTYFEDETFYEKRDARTKMSLAVQIGSATSGKVMLISVPNLQITDVQPASSEGLVGQTVTAEALEDEWCTDQTTEQRRSPIRFHC